MEDEIVCLECGARVIAYPSGLLLHRWFCPLCDTEVMC